MNRAEPLERLAADRQAARELGDGWAALCMLGTVNARGEVQQRTLVLRNLEDQLALFFSATAPKWEELKWSPTCSIGIYLPTTQVQYRLQATWAQIDSELVRNSWALRPDIPKKLDWLYQTNPQSSPLARAELEAALDDGTPTPEAAPDTAMGIYLQPTRIERLELSSGVHQRESFERDSTGVWQRVDLVP